MPRPRTIRTALIKSSALHDRVRTGCQAITASDLTLLAEDVRKAISDSIDLDEASREEHPESNRWDYIVSSPDDEVFAGVEPHSAKDSQIRVLIAKREHAIQYLRDHLVDGVKVTKWFWVTHGRVGFSSMERAKRRLDQNGIRFVGGVLKSLK